jgi:hypothetical protein
MSPRTILYLFKKSNEILFVLHVKVCSTDINKD